MFSLHQQMSNHIHVSYLRGLCLLFKHFQVRRLMDEASACERWETMVLTVLGMNSSWVSMTLFSSDVLELGQHWEKIGVSCVAHHWPTLELKWEQQESVSIPDIWWNMQCGVIASKRRATVHILCVWLCIYTVHAQHVCMITTLQQAAEWST